MIQFAVVVNMSVIYMHCFHSTIILDWIKLIIKSICFVLLMQAHFLK